MKTVNCGIWITTACPLACSYIRGIKNGHSSFFEESNLHIYYCTAARPRGGGLSGAGGGGALWGGACALLTATNSAFKTCNLQSNNAILIINVLVLCQSLALKAKAIKHLGSNFEVCMRNKMGAKRVERQKQQGGIIQTGSRCDSSSGQSGKR